MATCNECQDLTAGGCIVCQPLQQPWEGVGGVAHYVGDDCPGGHQDLTGEAFKFDDGSDKLRYDLIPPHALEMLASVYTHGAAKYTDTNYLKSGGMAYRRILAALMRHVEAYRAGETDDPDSGLPHMAHAAWQCFTLMAYSDWLDNPKDNRDMMKEVEEDGSENAE